MRVFQVGIYHTSPCVLGSPQFLNLCGLWWGVTLQTSSVFLRSVCSSLPNHLRWIISSKGSSLVFSSRSWLEMLRGQQILEIFRKHEFAKDCSFRIKVFVGDQDSQRYKSSVFTLELKILSLVLIEIDLEDQMMFNWEKAPRILFRRLAMSLAEHTVVVILLLI